MKLRLPLRFWVSLAGFGLLVAVIVQGPRFFIETSEVLTFSDEITVGAAHADPILPDSGLTLATERRVELFMQDLKAQPQQPVRWSRLNKEWLEYARLWFERVYPGEERFNRYTSLWVGKREKSKLWRLNCRNEFFPDMDDKELLSKAEWLKEQEEWQEMQAKIARGLATVDAEYEQALHSLLGENWDEFTKLHSLFLQDQLPKTGGDTKFFL
jgi:hypothetical protein